MKISQRQASYYRKRCMELEEILSRQRNRWASDWSPGWVHIESLTLADASFAKVTTARLLGHAVVLIPGNGTSVMLYADRIKP